MFTPKSLYESTILYIVKHIELYTFNADAQNHWALSFSQLTPSMRFDIIWELYQSTKNGSKVLLEQVLQDIDTVMELLQLGNNRIKLHMIFEDVQKHSLSDEHISHKIALAFASRTQRQRGQTSTFQLRKSGYNLASFLSDGGWYMAAETVLNATKDVDEALLRQTDEINHYKHCQRMKLETETQLLHIYSEYRHFELADEVFSSICDKKLKNTDCIEGLNLSAVYSEFSNYCYSKSLYREAYDWGLKAVLSLTADVPTRVVIDVLRQAGKASVLRRQFPKAEILLREALLRARDVYGENHLKYADCMVDYAFYLLNVDGVMKSVQAYEKALSVSSLT